MCFVAGLAAQPKSDAPPVGRPSSCSSSDFWWNIYGFDTVQPLMRFVLLALATTFLLVGCENELKPPIGRPQDGPARFAFLSSWEPSFEQRGYVDIVGYSFVLENVGDRVGAPSCEIRFRNKPLPGWSTGSEIGLDASGRVEGEALLPYGINLDSVLTKLEPVCRESTGTESWTGVPKRFFAMDGDAAYFELREDGYQIGFGESVAPAERQNIRGNRSHPEVVLASVEREEGSKRLRITKVDCIGRESAIC